MGIWSTSKRMAAKWLLKLPLRSLSRHAKDGVQGWNVANRSIKPEISGAGSLIIQQRITSALSRRGPSRFTWHPNCSLFLGSFYQRGGPVSLVQSKGREVGFLCSLCALARHFLF